MISNYVNKSKNNSESFRIQEVFLNHCRRNRVPVTIQGKDESMYGIIIGFDQESIILEQNDTQMLFYKSQVYNVKPAQAVHCIFGPADWTVAEGKSMNQFQNRYLN